jgi:hypothetical protein
MRYKLQVAVNCSAPRITSTELDIHFNVYEDRLQKKIKNNKLKRQFNDDFALEDTADLIEKKKKEDLESVTHNIKDRFPTSSGCIKKFKRDTSDDKDEEQRTEQYTLVPYVASSMTSKSLTTSSGMACMLSTQT